MEYNIVNDAEEMISHEYGEVMFINDIAIGISMYPKYDDRNNDEEAPRTLYRVTHLETGCSICKYMVSIESAISKATERINASYWQDSINKCMQQLKSKKIDYPVNDISKFKNNNMGNVNQKVAILSNGKNGKQIIKHLTSLGGNNILGLTGDEEGQYYFYIEGIDNRIVCNTQRKAPHGYTVITLPVKATTKKSKKIPVESIAEPEIIPLSVRKQPFPLKPEFLTETKPCLFRSPANIGVSVNDLLNFLQPLNNEQNTQIFIDAITKVYVDYYTMKSKTRVDKRRKKEEPEKVLNPVLPNATKLWEKWDADGRNSILDCIKASNIHPDDCAVIELVFDTVSELMARYHSSLSMINKLNDAIRASLAMETTNECLTLSEREMQHFNHVTDEITKLKNKIKSLRFFGLFSTKKSQ